MLRTLKSRIKKEDSIDISIIAVKLTCVTSAKKWLRKNEFDVFQDPGQPRLVNEVLCQFYTIRGPYGKLKRMNIAKPRWLILQMINDESSRMVLAKDNKIN